MLSGIINIAIVDDDTLLRKILINYISEQKNINVAIQSPDIPDLMSKLKNSGVQIVLMDLFMPKVSGNEAVKLIRNEYPHIKIIVLSMCADMDLLSDLLDLGVYGFISKTEEPEEIIRGITSFAQQTRYKSRLFTEVLNWSKSNNIKLSADAQNSVLNEREAKILQLLWEEKSNKEIAEQLFLSVKSVEKIRQDMREKIGVKSTIGLLKYAISRRLVTPAFSEYRLDRAGTVN